MSASAAPVRLRASAPCRLALATLALVCALCSGSAIAAPQTLDWDSVAWTPDGALTQSYPFGTSTLDFTFGGATGYLVDYDGRPSPTISDIITGGLVPAQDGLVMRVDHDAASPKWIDITLDFSSFPGGVSDVAFSIFDIDSFFFNHIDQIEVSANGGAIDPAMSGLGACVGVVDARTVQGTCLVGDTSPDGNARFTFAGSGITSVRIIYRNTHPFADPGYQEISLHDIDFTTSDEADLSLVKVVDDTTPDVGDTVTFTVSVTNGGPDDATNVTVGDLLPAGFTWVSDDSAGAYVPGTGVWTSGTIANGGTAVLNIDATVNVAGGHTNSAEVTASDAADPDSTPGNNVPAEDDQDSATVTPTPLSIVKSAFYFNGTPIPDGTVVPSGTRVKFLLYVHNPTSAFSDISFQDVLAPSFQYEAGSMLVGSLGSASTIWCPGGACDEPAIFSEIDTNGTPLGDGDSLNAPIDADAGSYDSGSTTVDLGDGSNGNNAQLDVAADSVVALVFTVQVQ